MPPGNRGVSQPKRRFEPGADHKRLFAEQDRLRALHLAVEDPKDQNPFGAGDRRLAALLEDLRLTLALRGGLAHVTAISQQLAIPATP